MIEDTDEFDSGMFALITDKMIVIDNESIEFHLIGGLKFTERIADK